MVTADTRGQTPESWYTVVYHVDGIMIGDHYMARSWVYRTFPSKVTGCLFILIVSKLIIRVSLQVNAHNDISIDLPNQQKDISVKMENVTWPDCHQDKGSRKIRTSQKLFWHSR